MKQELLIATNGHAATLPAIQYGAWLGGLLRMPVTLIGIVERRGLPNIDAEEHPLDAILSQAIPLFKEHKVRHRLEVHYGHAEDVIPLKAREKDYITVLSPLGRPPLRRLLLGRSFRHIMAEVVGPILYVPQARLPLKKMLVCVGGLGYEVAAEHLGLRLASLTGAEVILLSVVPPIDLDYPTARTVREQWEHLADTDTPPGRSLRQGLEAARAANLTASIKVRHGAVVDEILNEVKTGSYDLICMGSPYSAHGLRHYYAPNVTAEVAEAAGCPVLTARFIPES